MLTLIVPGLIWTRRALDDLTHDLALPAFCALLGRGRLVRLPPATAHDALARAMNAAAPLPAAALRRLAIAAHDAADGDDGTHWLCLDPVHLRLEERRMVVGDPARLALSAAEADALAVSLAPTFAALGHIEVLTPERWNLRLSSSAPPFPPPSPSLPDAIGRAAAPPPTTPAHAPWRAALARAQTELHGHPVNRRREAAGQPTVNSLWLWGAGRLPARCEPGHDLVWSDDPLAQGLARHNGIAAAPLPARWPAGPQRSPLAFFGALGLAAREGDALRWRDALLGLEAGWLAPALAGLRRGRLPALRLVAPGDAGAAQLVVGRGDLLRFWRGPKALSELAAP